MLLGSNERLCKIRELKLFDPISSFAGFWFADCISSTPEPAVVICTSVFYCYAWRLSSSYWASAWLSCPFFVAAPFAVSPAVSWMSLKKTAPFLRSNYLAAPCGFCCFSLLKSLTFSQQTKAILV